MKNVIKKIVEYVIVFLFLLTLCFYINKDLVLKAFYMDDLFHWSWFRGLNIFEFAFKFYEASRYRPVFDAIQYIFYVIIGTNPMKLTIINKVYNSLIALFIYHFAKRLSKNHMLSILISSLYVVAHYAYYQISQGIGSLESTALLLALLVLFYCLKLSGVIEENNNKNIKNIVALFILFFILVFTHERFLCTAAPIVIAIFTAKGEKVINKNKIIALFVFILEISLICYIRYLAIGKVMPAGTGGTYVEETFNIVECIKYCFIQVAFIFGINIGPDYLYGIDFVSLPDIMSKYLLIVSIALILVVILWYIVIRIMNRQEMKYVAADLLFLSFIAVCIGASSVTIRVELRFIYVSFTAAMLYLLYMCSFIVSKLKLKKLRVLPILLITLVFVTRIPIELSYRKYFPKIHCIVDMIRVNSIYDNTIGKYGVDDIVNNKKIYVINKYYGLTNFYAESILKIYDINDVGKPMIMVSDFSEIPPEDIGNSNVIILYEDITNNNYATLNLQ
ncbi:MAG: hypothetical protein IKP66_08265 [Lachnospiraceae bacterium]|nr:hypothetical protein [Lachnospiraceae bacterium]